MVNMLLGVHCKKSDKVDLRTPLWNYISRTYSHSQAQEAAEDLTTVQAERDEVISLTGSYQAQLSCAKKYFRALSMMESRFPISKDDHYVSMSFTWYDAFRPTKRSEHYSIHFEKACVLFNIGAVLTQQGLGCNRETETGVKQAAQNFREAAGVFGYMRDTAALRVEHPRPVDISPECAGMLERLCVAQAQECIYEKFCTDRKDSKTLAKLAKQVNLYYGEVLRLLSLPPLNAHFDKSWTAHVSVKGLLYDAETWIQQGAYHNKETECNIQLACLKEAQKQLAAARREIKQVGKDLADHLKRLEDWCAKDYASAEKDNNSVYLQRVPQSVDPVQGLAMAKGIVPDWSDATGDAMFASVIPDSSAKALSKYTSAVDTIIREQLDALTHASDEARFKLRSWELPDCLQALEAGSSAALPEALRKELEDLEDHGGVRHLTDLAAQIRDLRKVAQEELAEVTSDLDKEAKEDGDLRDKFGSRWTRASSAALTSHLREKVAGYEANLKAAGESDRRLEARLTEHSRTFSSLSIQSAAAQLPRLQAPMVVTGDLEPAVVVADLRKGLEAISKLSAERASLEEGLKQEKSKDNILPKLMACSGSPDSLFDQELKKYDPLKAKVAENVQRQHGLLSDIQKNQAAYRQAFGYEQWKQACDAAAGGIRGKLGLYIEVRDNMSEGLRFYMSLQEAIQALQQQSGDFVLTRKLESEELMDAMRRASSDEARRQSEAAARQRAQASFVDMNLSGGRPPQANSASQAYPPPYLGGSPAPSPGNTPSYSAMAQNPPGYPPTGGAARPNAYPPQQPGAHHYPAYPPTAAHSQPPYSATPPTQGSTPSYPPWAGGQPAASGAPQGYPHQQPPQNYWQQPQRPPGGSQQPPPYLGGGQQPPPQSGGAPSPYGPPQPAWPPTPQTGYSQQPQQQPGQQQQQQQQPYRPPWDTGNTNPFTAGSTPPAYPSSQPYPGSAPPNQWR